jgi:hypothetical protein
MPEGTTQLDPRNPKGLYDVFISHSTRYPANQRQLVDALVYGLEQEGLNVFLDRNELAEGNELLPSLESSVKESSIGIIVLTTKALNSAWVRAECKFMLRFGKPILGLLLEKGCPVPEYISHHDVIEFDSTDDLAEIVIRIKRAAGK